MTFLSVVHLFLKGVITEFRFIHKNAIMKKLALRIRAMVLIYLGLRTNQ
jgi:hypothetical protein